MTLMPVSKTSVLVDRLASGRRIAMDGSPFDVGRRRLAVDGVAEDVEHARDDPLADRHLQRPAGVLDRHAAGEALGGIQGDPADMVDIDLHQHLDGDPRVLPRVQQRVDGRQPVIEPHIDDASSHRRDDAAICGLGFSS